MMGSGCEARASHLTLAIAIGGLLLGLRPSPAWSQSHTESFDTVDVSGRHRFRVVLTAPKTVDPRALEYLGKMVRIVPVRSATRQLAKAWARRGKADAGDIVVSLTSTDGSNPADFMALPPDGFEVSAPGRIRIKADLYRELRQKPTLRLRAAKATEPSKRSGGSSPTLSGRLRCRAYDNNQVIYRNLPFAQVRVAGSAPVYTDHTGDFELKGSFGAGAHDIKVVFNGPVKSHSQSTPLKVMNEWHNARSESKRVSAKMKDDKAVLGNVTLTGVDCELFRLGSLVLDHYHRAVGRSPPAKKLRLKRWSGVKHGTPYTYYDYIVLTANFSRKGGYRSETRRRNTIFHEFGHSIRHVADGSEGHWGWDNFRWAYARAHSGCEVFNTQYAFNEGWAGYWDVAARGATLPGCGYAAAFRDWTEDMITQHLLALANALPAANADERARKMVDVLIRNRRAIHSLWEFEVKYCELHHSGNARCKRRGAPARAKPKSCPPGFSDDGATCRLNNIKAKPSHGRGVGVPPTGCPTTKPEYDAGLCYKRCRAGYSGVGPVCWQKCPSGFANHGAFCGKPGAYGRGAGYPWKVGDPPFSLSKARKRCQRDHGQGRCEKHGLIIYPKCKAGYHAAGCCICSPNCVAGMKDIGVSCQKKSYGRGVGRVPKRCKAGKEYDAGLCYKKCRDGYKGVGPVCWGKCPAGFADHGATCYRPPNILVKY